MSIPAFVRHEWARIQVGGRDLWISRDAYMVNGVRVIFSGDEARAKARELGGRLPTAREMDARWLATGFHNLPTFNVSWLTRADGYILHSHAIDAQLAAYEQLYGEPFFWIVGNIGKPWLSDVLASGADALTGGYHDAHTQHLRAAPIYPDDTPENDDALVVQRKWESSHRRHKDYTSTLVVVLERAPDEWVEISDEGYVVHVRRIEGDRLSESKPAVEPIPAKDTQMKTITTDRDIKPENMIRPTLAQGDRDPAGSTDGPVRTLQRLLLGYGAVLPKYGADGDYGDETKFAVRAAQRRLGLPITGDADAQTVAALEAAQRPLVPGIDVSSNQAHGHFDWPTIAKTQRWVIARATYGGRDFGSRRQHKRGADPIFVDVVAKARAAGMLVGAYHFFRQHQPAAEQLETFFAQLDAAGIGVGDIVPMIDLEDNQAWDGPLDPKAHHAEGRAMVEAVAQRYGRAGIYTAPYHPINLGLSASSWMLEHDIWIADPTNWTKRKGGPRWPDGWGIWQIGAVHIDGYADTVPTKGVGHVIDVNLARCLPLIGA